MQLYLNCTINMKTGGKTRSNPIELTPEQQEIIEEKLFKHLLWIKEVVERENGHTDNNR